MPPIVATAVWLVCLVALFLFDPAKEKKATWALWVPVIWIFTVATRLPSQWFGAGLGLAEGSLEEGNSMDRIIYIFLILLAIAILLARGFNWGVFVSRNAALAAYIAFALISVCWSDFAFVAFKRWFRDLGHYLVVLVALTDPAGKEAIGIVFRRLGYLLIPLSLLLYKYYPEMGIQYNEWTGGAEFVGPATSKNGQGVICLVCGLYFIWDTLVRWSNRKDRRTKRILLVNIFFIALTLHILVITDSATSRVCLTIGTLVMLAVHSKIGRQNPRTLLFLIPTLIGLNFLLMVCGIDIKAIVAHAVGRNPTLTDRTEIWGILLAMHTNPLIGTGYESFWLGSRLLWVAHQYGMLNEAHNGYLEVYLNLGIIGLFLLVAFLFATYRNISKRLISRSASASFAVALWTVTVFYNMTEAAFKWQLIWVTFLSAAIAYPPREATELYAVSKVEGETAPVSKSVEHFHDTLVGF